MNQVFDYVQLNLPVVTGGFASRQVGALSASVRLIEQKDVWCSMTKWRRGIGS